MPDTPKKTEETSLNGFSLHDITQAVYLSQLLVIFFGITPIIGIILNIVKRNEIVSNAFLKAHFDYQMNTFFGWIILMVVGFLLTFIIIGIPIIFASVVWMIYRAIRGWLAFRENKLPTMKATHGSRQ